MTGREPYTIIVDDLDQPERPGDRERLARWFDPALIRNEPEPMGGTDCPYCPKRPRNLAAHCRAKHPSAPEARR